MELGSVAIGCEGHRGSQLPLELDRLCTSVGTDAPAIRSTTGRWRSDPETPTSETDGPRHAHRVPFRALSGLLVPSLVLAVGCVVETLRRPSTVLHPELWAEDGRIWFQEAYDQGWLRPLTHPQVGYLQTFTRLVADAGLLIPLRLLPELFALVALVIQVMPAVLIVSKRYTMSIPDLRVRLLFAALYLCIPNSSEVNVNLTDAQWHLGLLSVLVVLAVPATGIWRVFDILVICLSGLTGPFILSVVLVAAVLYWHRRQTWTLVLGGIAAATGLVQVVAYMNSPRPYVGPLGASIPRFIDIVGGRFLANTILGTATTISTAFTSHLYLYSAIALVLGLVVVGIAVWKGPLELKLFNLFGFVELCAALWSPLVSPHGAQWPALALDAGSRYWLFPSLAFLVDVVWLAGQWRKGRRVWSVVGVVLTVVIVSFGAREDFRYPAVTGPSWPAQVARFDRLTPHHTFVFQIGPPGWTMTLDKK